MAFIIAGLGNPGEEYTNTRHNTGRLVLEKIAKKYNFPEFTANSKAKALTSVGEIGKEKVTLLEPNNFMNKSGTSIAAALGAKVNSKKPSFPNLIVIYDDLDLPIGKIKISYNKSSGGHRGLESIIKAVRTQEFIRIRVGISPTTPTGKIKKPVGEAAVEKHILGEFKKPELDILNKLTKTITELVEIVVTEGMEKAISTFVQK